MCNQVIDTYCPFCNKGVSASLVAQSATLSEKPLRWALNNQEPLEIGHVSHDDAAGTTVDHAWTANPEERKLLGSALSSKKS
jgi:hypothetical protein